MATEQRIDTPPGAVSRAHEHGWVTESAHRTSEGVVLYVRCAGCGVRRVDLRDQASAPPAALSQLVAETRSAITVSSA